MDRKMRELTSEQLKQVNGGYVVSDKENNEYYMVRQDGSVIAPAPSEEKAQEFIKEYDMSPTVMTKEEYKKRFGRDFQW